MCIRCVSVNQSERAQHRGLIDQQRVAPLCPKGQRPHPLQPPPSHILLRLSGMKPLRYASGFTEAGRPPVHPSSCPAAGCHGYCWQGEQRKAHLRGSSCWGRSWWCLMKNLSADSLSASDTEQLFNTLTHGSLGGTRMSTRMTGAGQTGQTGPAGPAGPSRTHWASSRLCLCSLL